MVIFHSYISLPEGNPQPSAQEFSVPQLSMKGEERTSRFGHLAMRCGVAMSLENWAFAQKDDHLFGRLGPPQKKTY